MPMKWDVRNWRRGFISGSDGGLFQRIADQAVADVETHQAVFQWVLQSLAEEKLLKWTTISVDATTLEANAALQSIVRRDAGEKHEEFLTRLAKESGIETPTRELLAKFDRQRGKKGSNDDGRASA